MARETGLVTTPALLKLGQCESKYMVKLTFHVRNHSF